MDELNHLGWVVEKTFAVAGYVFGIRTNDEDAGDWLSDVLGRYEVEDGEAEPYFSLWLGRDEGVGQAYHIVYREGTDVLRTLDPGLAAWRLVRELELLALRGRPNGVYLRASVVERDDVKALVPSDIVPRLRMAGRRVTRELVLPFVPVVAVDPETGTLVAVGRELDVPDDAYADLARRIGEQTAGAPATHVPPHVDVVCAFAYRPDEAEIEPVSGAYAAYLFAPDVLNVAGAPAEALTALGRLVSRSGRLLVHESDIRSTYERLRAVFERPSP